MAMPKTEYDLTSINNEAIEKFFTLIILILIITR